MLRLHRLRSPSKDFAPAWSCQPEEGVPGAREPGTHPLAAVAEEGAASGDEGSAASSTSLKLHQPSSSISSSTTAGVCAPPMPPPGVVPDPGMCRSSGAAQQAANLMQQTAEDVGLSWYLEGAQPEAGADRALEEEPGKGYSMRSCRVCGIDPWRGVCSIKYRCL